MAEEGPWVETFFSRIMCYYYVRETSTMKQYGTGKYIVNPSWYIYILVIATLDSQY